MPIRTSLWLTFCLSALTFAACGDGASPEHADTKPASGVGGQASTGGGGQASTGGGGQASTGGGGQASTAVGGQASTGGGATQDAAIVSGDLNATRTGIGDGEVAPSGGRVTNGAGSSTSAGASSDGYKGAVPSAATPATGSSGVGTGSASSGSGATAGVSSGGSTSASTTHSSEDTSGTGSGASSGTSSGVSADSPMPVAASDAGESKALPPAGTLTAGVWDDNRNFARFTSYRSKLSQQQLAGLLPFAEEDLTAANTHWATASQPKERLDIALVLDTTGSMSDELRYLQTEFLALSSSIRSLYPRAEQRWSLVVYRDQADAYVVRWKDFRTDAQEYDTALAEQAAGGGGDEPEAVDQALDVAGKLAWRTAPEAARLLFWVADAPHHPEKAEATKAAISALAQLDVRIYPVAGSGASPAAEAAMRTAAMVTGGRYIFLTNDSGYGGNHAEPTIPCYFVTHLDKAIARMVDIEMSAAYREPEPSDVLRTGGDPSDGACKLADGNVVRVF